MNIEDDYSLLKKLFNELKPIIKEHNNVFFFHFFSSTMMLHPYLLKNFAKGFPSDWLIAYSAMSLK